ncbi:MAG: HEAT repeat domain-containing protein [Planctomycetota bacterium]
MARAAAEDQAGRRPAQWLLRSPAWATALAMHIVAAVVLMNIVHFTSRPGVGQVFRLSFSASRPGPPGGAKQGEEDNGVNGKHNEDSPAAGKLDPADPAPTGVRSDLPPILPTASTVNLPGSLPTPGIGVSGFDGASGLFAGRGGAGRGDALKRFGGDGTTEQAVNDGLEWLAAHQEQNGSWDPATMSRHCPKKGACDGGGFQAPYGGACTGLATLAFLGAGHVPGDPNSKHAEVVQRSLTWLVASQDKFGSLDPQFAGYMYTHGICAFALCEAYALTQDPALRKAAQAAVSFTVEAQQSSGGWDYMAYPSGRSDTSISSWCVMALRSARAGRLAVPEKAWKNAIAFTNRALNLETGNIAYAVSGVEGHWGTQPGCNTMTAAGLATRQYLGVREDPQVLQRLLARIEGVPPRYDGEVGQCPTWGSGGDANTCKHWSLYYTYNATLACFHAGGQAWDRWNPRMRECTLKTQSKSGHAKGSWAPVTMDGATAGRIYATAMNVMNLEVYYRYLPCYQKGAEDVLGPLLSDADWAPVAARTPSFRAGWKGQVWGGGAVDPKTIAEKIELLKSANMMERREAVKALQYCKDEKVLPSLIAAARSEKTSLRVLMIETLATLGEADASIDFLIEELRNEKAEPRKAALVVLRKFTGQWFGEDAGKWEAWRKGAKPK